MRPAYSSLGHTDRWTAKASVTCRGSSYTAIVVLRPPITFNEAQPFPASGTCIIGDVVISLKIGTYLSYLNVSRDVTVLF